MPNRPKRPCKKPWCPALTDDGWCDEHRPDPKEYDKQRGSAAKRGYGARWREEREDHLRKNPFCVECHRAGRVELATVVDHIIPHRGDMTLFWDKSNWQSLCKPHHDAKTAREDGGFGNLGPR